MCVCLCVNRHFGLGTIKTLPLSHTHGKSEPRARVSKAEAASAALLTSLFADALFWPAVMMAAGGKIDGVVAVALALLLVGECVWKLAKFFRIDMNIFYSI